MTKETKEQRQIRREIAMLVIGVVLGGIFGIMGGLWSGYFIEWYKSVSPTGNPNWTPVLVGSTIILFGFTVYLLHFANKILKGK